MVQPTQIADVVASVYTYAWFACFTPQFLH